MSMSRSLRLGAAATVFAIGVAGCTNTTNEGSSTTEAATTTVATTTSTSAAPTTTIDPRLLEPLPSDPDVMVGTLANGLTYYVRENGRPGARAQLRLVVNAGSAAEGANQSGGAHFLEHMLFNGTETYPENELTRVLEGFGARFGPDVNAYTSFDETVYELVLATDQPGLLELGLDVLLEWAARATIAEADVTAERGVVLEEWRLRDAGVDGRIAQVYEDVLLGGTSYEGKEPIGTPESLRSMDAEALRRFYEDWYRPDMMAVVAVGDFDSDEVVAMIHERFSQIEADRAGRPPVEPAVPESTEVRIGLLADADQPTASVEIYFPGSVEASQTFGDRKAAWARLLAFEMLATRLNDDITRGDSAFLGVAANDFSYTRRVAVAGLAGDVPASEIEAGLEALIVEVERALQHGYNDTEFARALAGWQAGVDQSYASRASTQDVEFADRYVSAFLEGSVLLSADQEFELDSEILDSLTPADAADALRRTVEASEIAAVVIGPDGGFVPSEEEVAAVIESARAATIEPRPEDLAVGDSLLARPDPVEPVDKTTHPLGVIQLEYANGVRVHFVETDIAANNIAMGAVSPGGLSRVPDEMVPDARLIADIVAQSGVGAFDKVALDTFLADKFVSLVPYMDITEEGLFGSAASEDLETLMQLIHLTMASPRADQAAADSVIGEFRPFTESPELIPGLATTLELIAARWGDEPRYNIVPTADELDLFDLDVALDVFSDRFGDAGDFVFTFAGDLDEGEFIELANAYLGTLPATDRDDSWVDVQPDPPPGIVDTTVAVGESEQGFVTFLFTNHFERSPLRDVQVELLTLIADVRLRDRLREALAATYSPFISVTTVDAPDESIESFLQVSGDPDRLAEIVEESLAAFASLAAEGPTDEEVATAKEKLRRDYELISNEWWVQQMLFYAQRPAESLDELFNSFAYIDQTTAEDLRSLAEVAFPKDQYILVRQVPK